MKPADLLERLQGLDARLTVEDGRLRCNAPKGALTPELRAAMTRHKEELLELVRNSTASSQGPMTSVNGAEAKQGPLSFTQERLWVFSQLEPDLPCYHVQLAYKIVGALNTRALAAALERLCQRHSVLRASFATVDGRLVQRPSRPYSPVLNLRQAASSLVYEQIQQELAKPLDLRHGTLSRFSVFTVDRHRHYLTISIHHAAFDGASFNVFCDELAEFYGAYSRGSVMPLSLPSCQYTDFAVWQRNAWIGEYGEIDIQYWRDTLQNAPPLLELPTDRPRPPRPSHRGGRVERSVCPKIVSTLKQLCSTHRVTPYMWLLSAFQVLLFRYSGQADIVVGTAVSMRSRCEYERIIGNFTNTLALRADLSDAPSFAEFLRRTRSTVLDAFTHQDAPFERVVNRLDLDRTLSYSPVFQTFFVMQNTEVSLLGLPGLSVTPLDDLPCTAHFDLTAIVSEEQGQIRCVFEFSTDLFDNDSIQRLAGHFVTLLKETVADANQRVSELQLLTEPERHQLLVKWSGTSVEYPSDKCLHALFEQQAERSPDSVAVVFEGRELTYRQLNERANQLAHYLRSLGVGPETPVALCLERSPALVIGILGILKAGGAYVPLDADYPQERLRFMLADAQVEVLVTQSSLLASFPATECQVVCLDAGAAYLRDAARSNPSVIVSADNLAYVMFTSGSTGQPKGVEIRHRSVARLVFGNDYAAFGPDRVFLLLATASFDASTFELWGALLHGAKLVVAPDGLPDFRQLEELLKKNRVTTLWLTATLLNQVVEHAPETVSSVEQILTGGEALSVTHIHRAQIALGAKVEFINGYGPTENTTFTACYQIPYKVEPELESIPIGRPISNTKVYVLDAQRHPVPIGVPGELYISGAGLARGYRNRPEMTAEKFVSNPFDQNPESRLYRTGDSCRWRADGNLEFLGRLDDQVKLRGFRIELGEIETVLDQHPSLVQTVVTLREVRPGDKRLVAYCVRATDAALNVSELRSYLRNKLPDYMVPSAFASLDAVPLTSSGKVNRRALPEPEDSNSELDNTFVAPRNPIEKQMASIWCDVLGIEEIGLHDNFFNLGGHSLLAIKLLGDIENRLGLSMPLSSLFEHGSVGEFVAAIRQGRWNPREDHATILRPGTGWVPLVVTSSLLGELGSWTKLVELLPLGRPVYGLQLVGNDPYPEGCTTIERLATLYAEALQRAVPTGPLHLAGHSFGAFVAYEVARQLNDAGRSILNVVILDTGPRPQRRQLSDRFLRDLPSMLTNLPRWLISDLAESGPGDTFQRFLRKAKIWQSRMTRRWGRSTSSPAPILADEVFRRRDLNRLPRGYEQRANRSLEMLDQYQPGPYTGRVSVLRAQVRPLVHQALPDLGWGRVVSGPIDVRELAGHHGNQFSEANIQQLATALSEALD